MSYVQAVRVGEQPLQYHAASTAQLMAALRDARRSTDIAAAYQPDSLCGEQVLVDHISSPRAWHPGVAGACMACVAALP